VWTWLLGARLLERSRYLESNMAGITSHAGPAYLRRWIYAGLLLSGGLGASVSWAESLVSESREVSGFHGVSIAGAGRVDISRGAREGLVIEAPAETLEKIVTEVSDGILRISKKQGSWNLRGPIRIEINYLALDQLELSGSADVRTDWITAEQFDIGIRGSSDVDVAGFELAALTVRVSGSGDLDVQELTAGSLQVTVSGSGDVTLRGAVDEATISVRGSGNVETQDLQSRQAEAVVSGSGNVKLWATESLTATISGSGDISIWGDPEVQSRISGSGRIRARG